MNEWMNEWRKEGRNESTNEWMDEWHEWHELKWDEINELMTYWINEWMNDVNGMIDWTNESSLALFSGFAASTAGSWHCTVPK